MEDTHYPPGASLPPKHDCQSWYLSSQHRGPGRVGTHAGTMHTPAHACTRLHAGARAQASLLIWALRAAFACLATPPPAAPPVEPCPAGGSLQVGGHWAALGQQPGSRTAACTCLAACVAATRKWSAGRRKVSCLGAARKPVPGRLGRGGSPQGPARPQPLWPAASLEAPTTHCASPVGSPGARLLFRGLRVLGWGSCGVTGSPLAGAGAPASPSLPDAPSAPREDPQLHPGRLLLLLGGVRSQRDGGAALQHLCVHHDARLLHPRALHPRALHPHHHHHPDHNAQHR